MTKIDLIACLVLFFGIRATQALRCLDCDKHFDSGVGGDGGGGGPPPPTCYPPAATFPLGGWEICDYEWYGTAPFCGGSCGTADGVVVASSDDPNWCPYDTAGERVAGNRCEGCGGSSCSTGHKVLCKYNCFGVIEQM